MDKRLPSSRRCAFCGYDTTGIAVVGCFKCPECGKELDVSAGPYLKGGPITTRSIGVTVLPSVAAGVLLALEFIATLQSVSSSAGQWPGARAMLIVAAYLVIAGIATVALGLLFTVRTVNGLLHQYVPRHDSRLWSLCKLLSVLLYWPLVAASFVVALIGFKQMFS